MMVENAVCSKNKWRQKWALSFKVTFQEYKGACTGGDQVILNKHKKIEYIYIKEGDFESESLKQWQSGQLCYKEGKSQKKGSKQVL